MAIPPKPLASEELLQRDEKIIDTIQELSVISNTGTDLKSYNNSHAVIKKLTLQS